MIVNLRESPSAMTQIAQWQFQEWGWQYPTDSYHNRVMRLQEHLGNDPLPSTFVAFHNDFLAGTVSLVAHDMAELPGLSPWLASLFVAPAYRGKGIGTLLVKHAEQAAYAAGSDCLFLYTGTAADYFLDRDWGPVYNMQRPGGQVLVMERDLRGGGEKPTDAEAPADA